MNGPNLKTLRNQAGMSRAQLARRVGCTEGHIRNLENWGYQPSEPMAYRIAKELSAGLGRDVTLEEFSTGTDEPNGAAA